MQPIALDVGAAGLPERTLFHANDVRGVIEARAVDESRADPKDVDGNPKVLEAPDLLGVESARGDDADVTVSVPVERFAQQLHQARRNAAQLADRDAFFLLELAKDRAVDERLARVDAHAPQARAQGVRDTQGCIYDAVLQVAEARVPSESAPRYRVWRCATPASSPWMCMIGSCGAAVPPS